VTKGKGITGTVRHVRNTMERGHGKKGPGYDQRKGGCVLVGRGGKRGKEGGPAHILTTTTGRRSRVAS